MRLSGFYHLLYGVLDLASVSYHLDHYAENKEQYDMVVKAAYGLRRDKLNDKQWNILLSTLKTCGFQKLLMDFLKEFSFPNELFQFMEEGYGVKKSIWEYLQIEKSKINCEFVYEVCENDTNTHVVLVYMHLPMLYHIVLDPCVTTLLAAYNETLINFVNFKIAHKNATFFHKAESCDPWIEELYCYAFEQIFETEGNTSCRSANAPRLDINLNAPAFVLGTQGGNKEMSKFFIQRGN